MGSWAFAAWTFVVMLGFMTGVWLVSVRLRNASIVDIAWGPAFLVGAAFGFAVGPGVDARRGLVFVLVAVWAIRLALHIARRNLGHAEDYRYAAWREKYGPARYWWISLFQVFWLQATFAWIVALPVTAAMTSPTPDRIGPLDVAGALLWAIGFAFEAVGDAQLSAFKADPANAGTVMDRGVWGWTRHPNYFGEALLWWGIGVIALATEWWWAGLVGPAFITFLLLRVSGVAMLEKTIGSRRAGYAEYVARVPAFFPRPPRRPRPI
jgi:steroid 5-alpha reductase family enzyme